MGNAKQQTGERQATRSLISKTIVKKTLPKATIAQIKDMVLEKWPLLRRSLSRRLLKLLGENEQQILQLTSASSSPGGEESSSGSKKRAPWQGRRTGWRTPDCNVHSHRTVVP